MNAFAQRLLAGLLLAASLLAPAYPACADDLLRDESSGLQYLEIITGGASTSDPLPMVVAIHGLGDHPESFRLLLDDLPSKARLVLPRGPTPHGKDGYSWFDFHADDEEGMAELGEGIRQSAERIAKLIVELTRAHGGPARAVVCGFSQGGMLAFAVAAEHPELVAAAIPVSGYLPTPLWPKERPQLRPLPKILALHGEADRLVPLESARWSVEALRSNGYDATLRSWPGVAHALSPQIRAALMTSVVSAIEEISPPGTVLQGPPAPPDSPPAQAPAAPVPPPLAATP